VRRASVHPRLGPGVVDAVGGRRQDADAVILLHQLPGEADSDMVDAEIIVAKQRSGPVGIIKCEFFGSITTWKEKIPEPRAEQQRLPDPAPWERNG
jgi:hypothetical protein